MKTIHSPEYISLISSLATERKKLGISQKEAAQFLSISQTDISKIENLDRRLDVLELKRLLELYRVSSDNNFKKTIIDFFGI